MGRKKKRFIDKRNAVKYNLVHRSQKDPLIDVEDHGQMVLSEANPVVSHEDHVREQQKYGIDYDDDYDYLQHLKEPSNANNDIGTNLLLPEDVFGKEVKNDQQELQRIVPLKGPQLDWDPDIVKALDDVSEHEDDQQLEDNFIQLANTAVDDTGIDTSVDSSWWISRGDYRLTHDEYGSLLSTDGDNNSVDGRKSARFTEYSLSSAVVPRSDGLSMLDERFEEFMVEYDDDLIGPLDEGHDERECNEYEDDIIRSAVDEFIIKHHLKSTKLKDIDKSTCKMIDEYEGDEGEEGREGVIVQVERNDHEWDCESILSTYSNLYNHPTLIREEKKPTKSQRKSTDDILYDANSITTTDTDIEAVMKACTIRPKNETSEERHIRKSAIKDERRMRRSNKKSTQEMFKKEKLKMEKLLITNPRTKPVL